MVGCYPRPTARPGFATRADSDRSTSPAAQFYGTAGTPYVYDGQTNAQDYYNASKNIHTTYRQGKFTDNLSGYQINASATFNARPNGVYGCNFGGGPN